MRDVGHKVRKLVLRNATGAMQGEATSQMQLNWRRVRKEYFSVYLFRSAVTANSKRSMSSAAASMARPTRWIGCSGDVGSTCYKTDTSTRARRRTLREDGCTASECRVFQVACEVGHAIVSGNGYE